MEAGVPTGVAGSLPLGDGRDALWGAVVAAPDSEEGLPDTFTRLAELSGRSVPPVLVAVHGGTALTRTLLCERARLHESLPALLVDPDAVDDAAGRDRALTTVLSGRADLVGVPA
jgi:anthraniloyl-CoA monooxygenase